MLNRFFYHEWLLMVHRMHLFLEDFFHFHGEILSSPLMLLFTICKRFGIIVKYMFSNSWHKVILIKCKIDISYRFWKLIYHSWSQSEVSSLFYVLFWYVVIFSMIWLEVETLVWAIIEASLDWTFFQIMPPLFILEWYICITKDLYWYIANWYDTIPRN